MTFLRNIFCIMLVATTLFSCKTAQKATSNNHSSATELSSVVRKSIDLQPTFQSMEAKLTISAMWDGKEISMKSSLKMITDSCMLLSVQPFIGIEMVRVYITPQNITLLNRLNSQYYTYSFQELSKMSESVDFNTLQAIIANQLFLVGNKNISSNDFKVENTPWGYTLTAKDNTSAVPQTFTLGRNYNITECLVSDKKQPISVSCTHANFLLVNGMMFPHETTITLINGRERTSIKISITKLEFNNNPNVSFSIPARYTKGDITDLKF